MDGTFVQVDDLSSVIDCILEHLNSHDNDYEQIGVIEILKNVLDEVEDGIIEAARER
jgi:hypothetical protein